MTWKLYFYPILRHPARRKISTYRLFEERLEAPLPGESSEPTKLAAEIGERCADCPDS